MKREPAFNKLVHRSIQLDALAYVLIAGLLVLTAVLAFMVLNSIEPPAGWVLSQEYVQLIGLALVCVLVFYLLEQHGKLRKRLVESHALLEFAQAETERALKGLTTTHNAAKIMASVVDAEALRRVVVAIRKDFGVDAVAIVGDEVVVSCDSDVTEEAVADSVTRIASEAVRTASPLAAANEEDGSYALAVPLRVMGRLHGVLCMWQRHRRLTAEELEGLELLARVLELGWESQLLYEGVSRQLSGIVGVVTALIDRKMPGYAYETERIADLVERVGAQLGMSAEGVAEMRVAAQLRDLGTLDGGDSDSLFGTGPERRARADHPLAGAQLAELGNFSESIRRTILCHHECPDGTGYPMRLTAASIPLSAMVIHACETFIELSRTSGGPSISAEKALEIMRKGEGRTFDARVLEALTVAVSPASGATHVRTERTGSTSLLGAATLH